QDDEHDARVRELLSEFVGRSRSRRYELERQQIALDVPRGDASRNIDNTHDDEHPPAKEVQTACPTVLVEGGVVTIGTEGAARKLEKDNRSLQLVRAMIVADGQRQQCRREVVANFAEIQARMNHQDEKAADRERQVTRNDQPVTDPHPRRVKHATAHYSATGAAPRRFIRYSACNRQVLPPSLDASSRQTKDSGRMSLNAQRVCGLPRSCVSSTKRSSPTGPPVNLA